MINENKIVFTHGNQAIVEGALVAGCRFYAGYPITPSSEIAEEMSRRLPKLGGIYVQGEDELASINMIIGASMAGMKSMTATSGPGYSLMQEGIGLAVATETPIVVVDVMRVGPSTGIASKPWQGDIMQAKFGSHSDYEIITLYPWSVQEAFDLTIEAFNLAEKYMTPVILLSDGILARMRERLYIKSPDEVEIIERRKPTVSPEMYRPYSRDENLVPTIASFGDGYFIIRDSLAHDERGYYIEKPEVQAHWVWFLNEKIRRNADKIQKWDEKFTDDAEVVFVALGPMARIVLSMVREARKEGLKWGFFRPITVWPFPENQLNKAIKNASHVIVVEMSYGKLIYPVRWSVKNNVKIGHIPWLSYVAPSPDDIRQIAEREVLV